MKFLVIICVFLSARIIVADDCAVTIARGNGNFTSYLYQTMSKKQGNVLFSPISAHAILSLAYQGAVGKTVEAFKNVLNIPSPRETTKGYKFIMSSLNSARNVSLHIANKIFLQQTYKLRKWFKSTAINYFQSEAENINFTNNTVAACKINSWVDSKTESKIKNITAPKDVNRQTRLVLVNAIYFKSEWAYKFNPHFTSKVAFWISAKRHIDFEMMHLTSRFNYAESVELDAKILQIPYNNRDLNLVIILPNAKDGVRCLEAKLAKVDLSTLTRRTETVEVHLSLPKFKVETEILLNEPLKQLGLAQIFKRAELSNMIQGNESLRVSSVIQKVFINVNEEGTEATAATSPWSWPNVKEVDFCFNLFLSIYASLKSFLTTPLVPSFKVDRPFIFMLQFSLEKEQHILLMGKVAQIL